MYKSLVLLFVAIVMISGCAKSQEQKEIRNIDNNISVRLEGTVLPVHKQNVLASVAGYVSGIYVKNGDRVKKGDIIYSLDKELINLDINKTRAEINSLKQIKSHTLSQRRTYTNIPAINLAAKELKESTYLKSKGYISSFEANNYKKNYINAISANSGNRSDNYEKVKTLDTDIMNKKVILQGLEYKLRHSDAYAYIDGFVAGLQITKGEAVGRNRKVCSIVNLDKVIVKAGFATGLLPFIHKNQRVNISFVTTPPYKTVGYISQVNPIINPDYNRMTVEVVVPNSSYILQEKTRALVTVLLPKEGQAEVKKYFLNNKSDTTLEVRGGN